MFLKKLYVPGFLYTNVFYYCLQTLEKNDCDYLICSECCKTIDLIYKYNYTCINNLKMNLPYRNNVDPEKNYINKKNDNNEDETFLGEEIITEYLDDLKEVFLEDEYQDANSEGKKLNTYNH